MKAVCVVAHPDDCVIFARPFIDSHPEFKWTILYLTYAEYEPRAKEMSAYWQSRKVSTINLGYVDTYLDMENNKISFDKVQAESDIANIASKYDMILTHNPDGDYGHIHHKFVSAAASATGKPIVYFANWEQQNLELRTDTSLVLDQFPLHADVIGGFHDLDFQRYLVTDSAKELLDGKQ